VCVRVNGLESRGGKGGGGGEKWGEEGRGGGGGGGGVTQDWRKLHNEKLHDLQCSAYIIKVTN